MAYRRQVNAVPGLQSLWLRAVEEPRQYSLEEIGAAMGMTPQGVGRLIRRTLRKIQRKSGALHLRQIRDDLFR